MVNYWLIRGGRDGEHEDVDLSNNVVAIGWIQLEKNLADLEESAYEDYYQKTYGKKKGIKEVWSFVNKMAQGDIVLMPIHKKVDNTKMVKVGTIIGDYRYERLASNAHHLRPVTWHDTLIPLSKFGKNIRQILIQRGITIKEIPKTLQDDVAKILHESSPSLTLDAAVEIIRKQYAPGSLKRKQEDEVIQKFGRIFSKENISNIQRKDFEDFLLYEHNKHWTSINRQKGKILAQFEKLKKALTILLDENRPLAERLAEIFPDKKEKMVQGLDRAVTTPILLVTYPDKYAVYNEPAESAMKRFGVFPLVKSKDFPNIYPAINQKVNELARKYGLTLWQMDAVWAMGEQNSVSPQYFLLQVGDYGSRHLTEKNFYSHVGWRETPRDREHGDVRTGDYLVVYFASQGKFPRQIKKVYQVNSITKGNVRFDVSEIQDLKGISRDEIRHALDKGKLGPAFKNVGHQGFNICRIERSDYDVLMNLDKQEDVYSLEQLMNDTGLKNEAIKDIKHLLDEKKQIIFSGPPGTGKTHIAKHFAKYFTGKRKNIRLIQFHQSYSYEDFVEGIKPDLSATDNVRFTRANGALRLIINDCVQNPDANFVLIIDEINRGNISKVFGELIYLLEYRDDKIRLAYSPKEEFAIPRNLYIIGTMNSADRSIASLDYALRRRFYFVDLYPDAIILESWLRKNSPLNPKDVTEVCEKMRAINELIKEKLGEEYQIGQSYFMLPDLTLERIKRIVKYAIKPLVQQYFFDDKETVRKVAEICGSWWPSDK